MNGKESKIGCALECFYEVLNWILLIFFVFLLGITNKIEEKLINILWKTFFAFFLKKLERAFTSIEFQKIVVNFSCLLLLWMARMDIDWNLKKSRQRIHCFNDMPAKKIT